MKIVSVGYVPPPSFGFPEAFLTNIRRFRTRWDVLLYSDHDWPDTIRIKGSPEIVKPKPHEQNANRWAVNNLVWLTALAVARKAGADFMIYLESDCRVGKDQWDFQIYEEARVVTTGTPEDGDYVAAGSMVWYSPCNKSVEVVRKWQETCEKWNKRANIPIPTYGASGSAERHEPCCLVNGALGIYNMKYMDEFFPPTPGRTTEAAKQMTAWDFHIGVKTWQKWGVAGFDKMIHLTSVFSSYGDVLTSEEERRAMLEKVPHRMSKTRRCVAVHQIKSNWEGPPAEVGQMPAIVEPPADLLPPNNDTAAQIVERVTVPTPAKALKDAKTDILIVSYAHDALFCSYNLRSISKFATGFNGVKVVVPRVDEEAFAPMCKQYDATLILFDEAKAPKGHLHHNVMKCMADVHCHEADFVLHTDSDCVFTQPVTPADYFESGKPILWHELYEPLKIIHPGRYAWKVITDANLGWDCAWETMARHPAVHHRWLYPAMRQYLEKRHGLPFEKYVLKLKATRPAGFAEFNVLGSYAHKFHYDAYAWVDMTGVTNRPAGKLKQFSGYHGMTPQDRFELEKIVS